MRRLIAIGLGLVAAAALVVFTGGASGDASHGRYWVEFDNAFGLIEGGDVKIAGVRAGKITGLELDPQTLRARVQIQIDRDGFGSVRTDVTCETRPQSLIGEYFVDCAPGTAPTELRRGATIPVERTTATIPPDLVNTVLRRPFRERLSIILGELGAGLAGNGSNLDDALRRASPALRETDRVLATLASQNKVLTDLTVNADKVIGDLAEHKGEVGRFVTEARDTAVASAARRDDIALGFRRLPGFLRELTPTMTSLGDTAESMAPTLRNLHASAGQLDTLFTNLEPYANVSRPAFRALARAASTGRGAVTGAVPVVKELNTFTKGTPELGHNLAMILEHLDDPAHAVEDDPRAAKATGRPAPTGYTGLEALLTYVYDQTLSTNIYDRNSHILKISLVPLNDDCASYAGLERGKKFADKCSVALGPNQPGLTFPDQSKHDVAAPARKRGGKAAKPAPAKTTPTTGTAPTTGADGSKQPGVLDLPPLLPGLDLPPIKLPGLLGSILSGGRGSAGTSPDASLTLLDYLLGR